MRIVAALGGNALLKRGEPMTAETQRKNVSKAAAALAPLIKAGHQLIITHGNGPQVGILALQAASGPEEGAYPLDILDAESEGMVGYLIEQELTNQLPESCRVATLLTQIEVDMLDPAFQKPTKPIGPVYSEIEAKKIAHQRKWHIAPDGNKWRRVVPSPKPKKVLEAGVIQLLAERGITVICVGGGGIPVIRRNDGTYIGIEAVIDKDLASALLAIEMSADQLLLLTDVDSVYLDWGKPNARAIGRTSAFELARHEFAAGSMGPKVQAAIDFVTKTGKFAAIGRLEDAMGMIDGKAGTIITH